MRNHDNVNHIYNYSFDTDCFNTVDAELLNVDGVKYYKASAVLKRITKKETFMKHIHIQKDGDPILIDHMEDEHLINTIRHYMKPAMTKRLAYEKQRGGTVNELRTAMLKSHHVSDISPEAVSDELNRCLDKIAPYLFYAWIRGMTVGDVGIDWGVVANRVPKPKGDSEFDSLLLSVKSGTTVIYEDEGDD